MRELVYGSYKINPDLKRNREIYGRRGPHLLKCSCPGCQNFFKSIVPYQNELAAALSPLGVSWDRPDSIEALDGRQNTVLYRLRYTFYGGGQLPQKWESHKNELGQIHIRTLQADYGLNEKIYLTFSRRGENKLRLEIKAELPWLMETLNCIYDPEVGSPAKRLPSRALRVKRGVKRIWGVIKNKK